jgi:hypothetical protein
MIWDTMTSPPYNVKPGFHQYHILIMSLLSRGHHPKALEYMRAARQIYDRQCAVYEAAVFDYIRDIRTGVEPTASFRIYQRARFLKQYNWLRMMRWSKSFLKSNRLSHSASRQVPDFIQEFREFVANPARYTTPTGYVQLLDPAEEFMHRMVVGTYTLGVPMRQKRKWQMQRVLTKQKLVLSSHSLADQTSSRADPWTLLSGDRKTFMTPQLKQTDEFRDTKVANQKTRGEAAVGTDVSYDDDY